MQLNVTVTFAARRYHGRTYGGEELEFPPSPARLFQALIAASHCGAYGLLHIAARDRALRWLEELEPPLIEVPVACTTGVGIINYVPNNDSGKKEQPLEHVRTDKSFLAKVFPDGATLTYQWSFEKTPEAEGNAAVILAMTKLITHLGQHQDIVYSRGMVSDDVAVSGNFLGPVERKDGAWTTPTSGSLAGYQSRYRFWLSNGFKTDAEVPVRNVNYRRENTITIAAPLALFEMWRNEDERLRYDPRALRQPAAMVRHTMIEWMKSSRAFSEHYGEGMVSWLIAGHDVNPQPNRPHIACVPLPSINPEGQADGLIRRVLVIGYGCDDQTSLELFESVTDGINGAELLDQGKRVGYLRKAALSDAVLRVFRSKGEHVWRTVTPIILTGLMRRGRGAEALVVRALKQAGVPENAIDSVAVFSGPIVAKSVRALDYQIERESYLAQTPRYHAEVIFNRPVEGTLVIGRGRYCGFGLLMPC